MNKTTILLVASVVVAFQAVAQTNDSFLADYSPYLDGKPWPKFPVVAYRADKSNVWMHPSDPGHFPKITETHDRESDFTTVVLRLPDGSVYKTYNDFVLGPYLSAVYSGDFNNDGIPDFVACKPGCGNGLAGENCTAVFAISDGHEFRFTRVRTMGFCPQHLVIDPATKNFRLIQMSFRGAQGSNGRYHTFWVHRFYKWENMGFQEDSTLEPIWIQYLNRPNHEPTRLLTKSMKEKAWLDDSESRDKIEW